MMMVKIVVSTSETTIERYQELFKRFEPFTIGECTEVPIFDILYHLVFQDDDMKIILIYGCWKHPVCVERTPLLPSPEDSKLGILNFLVLRKQSLRS
jgi:hypothetical protein